MALFDFLFGKERSVDPLPTQSQGQQDIMGQIFQMLGGGGQAGQGLDQSLAALMGMIGLSSSGFGQSLGGAGAQFEADMATLGSDRQTGAIQDILKLYQGLTSQALGTQQFQNVEDPASEGFLPQLLAMLAKSKFGG